MGFNPGYQSAQQLLNVLISRNPQNKKIVDYILSQGLSQDDIARYMSGMGMSESEKSDVQRKLKGKERIQSLLNFLKQSAGVVAGGYGTYKAYQGLAGMAGNLLGGSQAPQGPGPTQTPPTPSSGLAQSILGTPQAQNLAQTILGIASAAPGPVGTAAKAASALYAGKNIAEIVKQVSGLFGFKNKVLVNAVANIAEQTGKDVKDIYRSLSKEDISTPEKATSAASRMLKELTGEGKIFTPKEHEARMKAQKKVETAKPLAETIKNLQKDLKSAVIKKTLYDADKNELRVIFNNNHQYRYADVPGDRYRELTKGGVPAKTSGENEFGIWWVGKKPSLGATFNKLIKQGGYDYERIGDYEPTEKEEEEYRSLAGEAKQAFKKFESEAGKTHQKAITEERLTGPRTLTPEQVKARRRLLTQQLESIKEKSGSARVKEAISTIENRLKHLEEIHRLDRIKKAKVLTEETIRFEKAEGKRLITRLLTLLPPAIVKSIKKQIEHLPEEEILKDIQKLLRK